MGVPTLKIGKLFRGAGVIASLFLLAAIPVLAQVPTGTILGTVKDSSGAVVAGAAITITNQDTGFTRTETTSDDGTYRAPALPTGHYTVRGERTGFRTETQQGLTLNIADNAVINFTLQVGTSAQEVVVTSEAPLVNTSTSALGGLVNEQQMAELPLNGRNYIDLSLLQPGVTLDKNGGGGVQAGTAYSANGASVRSNFFTLDGAPVGTMFGRSTTSQAGNSMGVDGIKEYKVVTSNFAAEYGMTMGSQMAMVSKNGTNQFHGTAFEFLRNSSLDARNYFDNKNTSGTKRLPEFRRNNFGGSFGGPIRKDKTFFFAVYEGIRQTQGVTALETVIPAACHPTVANAGNNYGAGTILWNGSGTPPAGAQAGACTALGTTPAATSPASAAVCPQDLINPANSYNCVVISPVMAHLLSAVYNIPNNGTSGYSYAASNVASENYGQMRVDENFSASDSGFARYTIQNGFLDAAAAGASSSAGPQYKSLSLTRNQFLSLVENHIFSTSVVNTARLSYSRTAYNQADEYTQNLIDPTLSFNPGFPTGRIQINGGPSNWFPGQNFPQFGSQNIYALSDDVNYAKGKHSFKFGTLINRYLTGIQQTRSRSGIMRFAGVNTFLLGQPTQLELETPGSNQNRYYSWYALGFYAQDDWRVAPRLTLNLGLRYEFLTQLNELNGRQAAFRNWNTDAAPTVGPTMRDRTHLDFSPRIGFAWDVMGDGKTSIRGGFGIYYDHANIGTALEQTTLASEPFSSTSVITNYAATLSTLNLLTIVPPFTPGQPSSLVPQGIDYNSYRPSLMQYNLTAERQFPGGLALALSYAGSRGAHLWTINEGNPEIPATIINGVPSWFTTVAGITNPDGSANAGTPRVNQALIQSGYGSDAIIMTTKADSWYNSLQAVVTKKLGNGLQFQGSYTFSKVLDTYQGQMNMADCSSSSGMQAQDPLHPLLDKGPACFDATHNFRLSLLYHFPTVSSNGIVSKLANGWWMGNIVSLQSGYAYSPVVSNNRSQSNAFQAQADRLNYGTATVAPGQTDANGFKNNTTSTFIPYDKSKVVSPHPDPSGTGIDWWNPLMFVPQAIYAPGTSATCPYNAAVYCSTAGTAGRNILRGPGFGDWDFSLVKDTKLGFLGEAGSLQFRAEFFNVLNHTNWGSPTAALFNGAFNLGAGTGFNPYSSPAGTAGRITSTTGTSRQIQLGLKIIF